MKLIICLSSFRGHTDSSSHTEMALNAFVFFLLRPNSSAGLRGVGPRRVQSSFCTCLKMLRAMPSWRYGHKFLLLRLWIFSKREVSTYFVLMDKMFYHSRMKIGHICLALVLKAFLNGFDFRVWMWTLWSSNTSRSTRPPRWGGARIVLTAASTPTWALRATSRWSWPRRSRSSPNQRRRSLRRKRYGGVDDRRVQTNRFCSLHLSEHAEPTDVALMTT